MANARGGKPQEVSNIAQSWARSPRRSPPPSPTWPWPSCCRQPPYSRRPTGRWRPTLGGPRTSCGLPPCSLSATLTGITSVALCSMCKEISVRLCHLSGSILMTCKATVTSFSRKEQIAGMDKHWLVERNQQCLCLRFTE